MSKILKNNIQLEAEPTNSNDIIKKKTLDNEVNKIESRLDLSLEKTIVCIIDDDGTTRSGDSYTGMTTWLNGQGIPMNFAICYDTIGTGGKYTVSQLQDLQAKGNDILIHGNTRLQDFADENAVIEELEKAKQFNIDNGLTPTDVYVYPNGLNDDTTLTCDFVKEIVGRYFDYGLSVNIASMSKEDTKGVWNKVPLQDKLNLARMEVSATKGLDIHKTNIDNCISNKGLLILFTHSFMSQFLTGGGYEEFKKIIEYLSTQDVEFLTVSKAFQKIEDINNNNKFMLKESITTVNENATSEQVANAKSVYDSLWEDKTRTVVDTLEHYELASVQDGTEGLLIVDDGTLTDASIQVELSTVQNKILSTDTHSYASGEYVNLIAEVNHTETYKVEKYARVDQIPEGSTTMTIQRLDDMWGTVIILDYKQS